MESSKSWAGGGGATKKGGWVGDAEEHAASVSEQKGPDFSFFGPSNRLSGHPSNPKGQGILEMQSIKTGRRKVEKGWGWQWQITSTNL